MFEAVLLPEARAVRDALREEDRADINRIVRLLELNPWADGTVKFTMSIGRWAAGVYDDGRWEVVYRVIDERFIEVIGMSRIG